MKRRDLIKGAAGGVVATAAATSLTGCKDDGELKKAMEERLGKDIVYRKKKGFGIPVADWLKGPLKPLMLDLFSKPRIEKQELFNFKYVNRLIQDHLSGKRDNRKPLWTLLVFQQWYKKYLDPSL